MLKWEKIGTVTGGNDLLSVTDFGYQTGIETGIRGAKKRGWRIEWRDHHRWEEKEMDRIGRLVDFLHVDTNLCATGITAGDLRPGDPVALEVAKVVCDYDLWKNQDPRAAVLARVLSREQNRTYVRECLVKGKFTDPFIEQQYRVIQGELDTDIRRSIRRTHLYVSRYRIAVARLFGSPSETAAAIRKEMKSDIEILVYPSGRFSIRSIPPISHLIAREFQGGGHAHAAGGSLNFSFWDRLLFHNLRNNRKIRHLVEVAESTG